MTTKVLILGGGFSGFFTARHLKRLLKNKVSIELINRENYFVFQPLLPEVAGGSISAQNAVSPLRFLIRDIKIRKAEVESIILKYHWFSVLGISSILCLGGRLLAQTVHVLL